MNGSMRADEAASPENDQHQDDEDFGKRRRIARACDMCRKKKIRCDGDMHRCSNCVAYHTECIFTDLPKKRAPPRGAKYIQNLEERLAKMERLLRAATQSNDSEKGRLTYQKASETFTDGITVDDVDRESSGDAAIDHDADELAERMGVTFELNGEAEYLGASSTATSVVGAQKHIREILGNNSFDDFCSNTRTSFSADETQVETDFLSMIEPESISLDLLLPDRALCNLYIDMYFDRFQHAYPLLDRQGFMEESRRVHELDGTSNPAFLVVYLMVVAFGSHLAHEIALGPAHDEGFRLYAEAHKRLYRIMHITSLHMVQAMILVCHYLEGTRRPQALWMLLGPLVRSAQSLGLHRGLPVGSFKDPTQRTDDIRLAESRKRAFWHIYLLDNNAAVATGKPAAIQDFDCDQDLPKITSDEIEMSDGLKWSDGTPFSVFLAQIQLAKISHQVQKRLYSIRALATLSGEQLTIVTAELDSRLLAWLATLPEQFRPDPTQNVHSQASRRTNRDNLRPIYHDVLIPLLLLRYFSLMVSTHRRNMFSGSHVSTPGSIPPSPESDSRTSSSHAIAVHAARSSLGLLGSRASQMQDVCVQTNISHPIAAALVLFTNLIRNPGSASCGGDIGYIKHVVTHMEACFYTEANWMRVIDFLQQCIKISEFAVARATGQHGTKRSHPGTSSMVSSVTASTDPMEHRASNYPPGHDLSQPYVDPTQWSATDALYDSYDLEDFSRFANIFGTAQFADMQAGMYNTVQQPMTGNMGVSGGVSQLPYTGALPEYAAYSYPGPWHMEAP